MADLSQLAEVVAEAVRALPLSDEVRITIRVDEGSIQAVNITARPPGDDPPDCPEGYYVAERGSMKLSFNSGLDTGGASP